MPEIDFVQFDAAGDRHRYMIRVYGEYIRGRVLDVGCRTRILKQERPALDYVGIDIAGDPDILLDLEQIDRLPFDDGHFDCVVCNDVLEHIDTFHLVFRELLRVSSGHVIVSLPNCWRTIRGRLARGHGTPQYYGLPAERPVDRHKWFFNVTDVLRFMDAHAREHPVRIVSTRVNVKPRFPLVRIFQRLRSPRRTDYLNRHAHSVWTVLAKQPAGSAVTSGADPA